MKRRLRRRRLELVAPTVPCHDTACPCCTEWVRIDRATRAHYVDAIDSERRLSDTLWERLCTNVLQKQVLNERVASLQRQLLDERARRG